MVDWDSGSVEVEGWDLTQPAETARYVTKDGVTERKVVLPFGVVPRRVWADEHKQVRGFEVEFVSPDARVRTVDIPSRFIRAARPADVLAEANGPDLPSGLVKHVVDILFDVANGVSNLEPDRVMTHTRWYGDTPWVPGNGVQVAPWLPDLAVYGQRADVDEAVALKAWRTVCRTAMFGLDESQPVASFRMMAVLGFPLGSMYLSRWGNDTFAMHITGESHQGKTEAATMAMAVLGDARKPNGALYRTWNMSEQAPVNLMKAVGIVPVFFDEAVTSGQDPEGFNRMLFNLAQGRGRIVANVDGTNRGDNDRWESCILSTGEMRLSNKSSLTGLRRRVFEVYSPVAKSQDVHAQAFGAAMRAYGWPVKWFTDTPNPSHARATYDAIFGELAMDARDQQVEAAQASNIAACFAGFVQLCRVVGVAWDRDVIMRGAHDMFSKLQAAARDEGADVGERAIAAIREAVNAHPQFFPAHDFPTDLSRDRWGVLFKDEPGVVGVIGKGTLERIMRDFGGKDVDVTAALVKLASRGLLLAERGTHQGRRSYFRPGEGLKVARLYLFKVDDEGGTE